MRAMSLPVRWNAAAAVRVARDGGRRPETAQLGLGLPTVDELFAFMRDAELRFDRLRLRLRERTWVATGELVRIHELLLQHPGRARVTVSRADDGASADPDVWLSDGETISTFAAAHRLTTSRRARPRLVGLDHDQDLPGSARAYRPVTALPANTLVDTVVHPAGFCQNVLTTGRCRVLREELAAGRTAIVLECLHPRTVELPGDRPDHRLVVAVDRETGLIAGLAEYFGSAPSRVVQAIELEPDAAIPEAAFTLHAPADAATIY